MTLDLSYIPSWLKVLKECVMLMAEAFAPIPDNAILERRFSDYLHCHDAMIRRICLGYSRTPQDLEDLYQDVLVNIWRGLPAFRGDSQVKTWIYRIALNTCVSTLRIRSKTPVSASIDDVILVPDDSQEMRDAVRDLYECIAGLGPIDKAVMMMWLDEYSYDEIADTVGLKRNAVATRIHRAKQQLKRNLQ